MSFTLEKVVPWGRSFDEYVRMFDLVEVDLQGRVLGCGDGPASFNSQLTKQSGHVVSVDPIYAFSADAIRERIEQTYAEVIEQTRKNLHEFLWTSIRTVEELGQLRMTAMQEFLADYPQGKEQGRYVAAELPDLPFVEGQFDLALCSHFLFLYSEHLSEAFHVTAIRELCRVASEVRIFPLLELGAKPSRHLAAVTDRLQNQGYSVSTELVSYEFQRGGNQMMRVRH